VEALKKDEAIAIPGDFDYTTLASLKAELRQKLELHRPSTLAQAARIEGMTPAALMLLLASVKKLSQGAARRKQAS
jgi:tRNA uridine 5-carboxymethylaminomethyl modification enzyme